LIISANTGLPAAAFAAPGVRSHSSRADAGVAHAAFVRTHQRRQRFTVAQRLEREAGRVDVETARPEGAGSEVAAAQRTAQRQWLTLQPGHAVGIEPGHIAGQLRHQRECRVRAVVPVTVLPSRSSRAECAM
jgi:hypothetical protein